MFCVGARELCPVIEKELAVGKVDCVQRAEGFILPGSESSKCLKNREYFRVGRTVG